MQWARKQEGFTIVELLIVIVVIAILATITIVTYGNMQRSARNAQMISVVDTYRKALVLYATKHGKYPGETGGNYYACLGSTTCYNGQSWNNNTFNEQLEEVISLLPTPPQTQLTYGPGGTRWGAAFIRNNTYSLDGTSHPWWLWYILEGDSDICAPNNLTQILNGATMSFSSVAPTRGWTESAPNHACWEWLPNPADV